MIFFKALQNQVVFLGIRHVAQPMQKGEALNRKEG